MPERDELEIEGQPGVGAAKNVLHVLGVEATNTPKHTGLLT